jgi:hypothetical protein
VYVGENIKKGRIMSKSWGAIAIYAVKLGENKKKGRIMSKSWGAIAIYAVKLGENIKKEVSLPHPV